MNLSLIPKSTRPAPQSSGALAKVYTKDGRSIRVPLRAVQTMTCTTCSQNPERQFMRWFTRQSAANPGFPIQVKSILLIVDQQPCLNCRRMLISYLNRYKLAKKLRLQTLTNADQRTHERGFNTAINTNLTKYESGLSDYRYRSVQPKDDQNELLYMAGKIEKKEKKKKSTKDRFKRARAAGDVIKVLSQDPLSPHNTDIEGWRRQTTQIDANQIVQQASQGQANNNIPGGSPNPAADRFAKPRPTDSRQHGNWMGR